MSGLMTAEEAILTVQEVNQRLPLIRAIVRDVVDLKADILQRQDRLLVLRELHPVVDSDETPYAEEVVAMEDGLVEDGHRLAAFEDELHIVGAVLIDAQTGLVEFASELDGRSIRLSWMPNESEVTFWREASDAVSDRKPSLHGGAEMPIEASHSES